MTVNLPRLADPDDFNGIRDEIVRLRCEGRSYEYITTATGVSYKKVRAILSEEFEAALGDRKQLIGELNSRYEFLYTKLMEQFKNRGYADAAIGKLVLQVMQDKRRLLGTDSPAQVQVTHSIDELSLEEVNARLAQYEALQLPPKSDAIDAEFQVRQVPASTPTEKVE